MLEELKKSRGDSEDGEAGLRLIIESSPDAILIIALNGMILFANPAAEGLFERIGAELVGTNFGYPVIGEEKVEIDVPLKDGSVNVAEMRAVELEWAGNKAYLLTLRDITERKRAELLTTVLTRITGVFLSAPDEEVYGEVLRFILEVMESKFGLFGLILDNGDLVIPSISREVWNECQVPEKSIVFPPHAWGKSLWGRAIREKKAFYSNDPFHTPEGHLYIYNFLSVPVIFGNKTIGLLSVANKAGGYTEEHKNLLGNIAVSIAPILNARQQRDIHEQSRKQSEEALRKREAEFRLLAEAMPQIVWITGPDGWNIYFNRQWMDYTGQTLEESNGHGWNKSFHPDDRQRAWDAWQNAIKHTAAYSLECRLRRADGVYKWWLIRGVPVMDDHGAVLKWFGTCTDIDDMKRAEEELKTNEERFRTAAENLTDVLFEWDTKDKLYWYGDIDGITGYSPGGFPRTFEGWRTIIHPEDIDRVLAALKDQLKGMVPYAIEYRVRRRDGEWRWWSARGTALRDDGGKPYKMVGSITDITEHKLAEEEKLKLENQLRHAQKMESIGTLAGGIAHDFNNILHVIIGYGIMVDETLPVGSSAREQMTEVLRAADRAATLTKRLLIFSRKQAVDVKPVNINELVLSLQKIITRVFCENIDVTLTLTEESLIVQVDAGQIEQVLMNLAVNARDAMPDGGRLKIGTAIENVDEDYVAAHGYGKPGTYALISVSDTGHGIDPETQKKIFEPFFTTKGVGEGTGLGLAISYGIIKQHGGYIKVYSEPGQGTVFKILLPLSDDASLSGKQTPAPDAVKGGTETLLVAEDDAALRDLTRIVLESFSYRVITASNGEEAILKFMKNRETISLVLLDMIMPKKNGHEISEAIKKVNQGIKILFMSGYTMDILNSSDLADAGVDFINKPFQPKELLKKVREMLDK